MSYWKQREPSFFKRLFKTINMNDYHLWALIMMREDFGDKFETHIEPAIQAELDART